MWLGSCGWRDSRRRLHLRHWSGALSPRGRLHRPRELLQWRLCYGLVMEVLMGLGGRLSPRAAGDCGNPGNPQSMSAPFSAHEMTRNVELMSELGPDLFGRKVE